MFHSSILISSDNPSTSTQSAITYGEVATSFAKSVTVSVNAPEFVLAFPVGAPAHIGYPPPSRLIPTSVIAPGAILTIFLTMATPFQDARAIPAAVIPSHNAAAYQWKLRSTAIEADFYRRLADATQRFSFDKDQRAVASRAVLEGINFVQKTNPAKALSDTHITEDGFLSLQWEADELSILVIFTGSGTSAYSLRKPSESFTDKIVSFSSNAVVPRRLRESLV